MSHPHAHTFPEKPGRLGLSRLEQGLAAAAVLAGAAALAWAFSSDASLAWSAYLIGAFYALGLGVFGAAWLAILYLSRGTWSVTMRRIPEAMTAWLLPGGLLALAVGLGAHSLYHWSHADVVAQDELLTHKAPFLNMPMFWALVGASLVLWVVFAALLVGTSHRQDRDGGIAPTRRSPHPLGDLPRRLRVHVQRRQLLLPPLARRALVLDDVRRAHVHRHGADRHRVRRRRGRPHGDEREARRVF